MPGKIDKTLPNKHKLFLAGSGGGKTYAIEHDAEYLKAKRVIAWDPESEYNKLQHVTTPSQLARALLATKPSAGIRIALTCDDTPENFEKFCNIVWEYISASWPTLIIAEELADVQKPGRASHFWGKLARRARKYGGILYPASQRPAEIDKTIYNQCVTKWVGRMEMEDAIRAAKAIGLKGEDIAGLPDFHAYVKTDGKPAVLLKPDGKPKK